MVGTIVGRFLSRIQRKAADGILGGFAPGFDADGKHRLQPFRRRSHHLPFDASLCHYARCAQQSFRPLPDNPVHVRVQNHVRRGRSARPCLRRQNHACFGGGGFRHPFGEQGSHHVRPNEEYGIRQCASRKARLDGKAEARPKVKYRKRSKNPPPVFSAFPSKNLR